MFLALNDTQQRFGISDELLEQLVAGTTMDLEPQPEGVSTLRLERWSACSADLRDVCGAASVLLSGGVGVGLVCIRIFGYSERRAEQLAVDTGIAFQLTNILRDVREDAERGRIYLSQDLFRGVRRGACADSWH